MERHKKDKRHRTKVPRVPIKTYKWEDIRRARVKGGYPWTYLYKDPFDEELDSDSFTMEAMSKSKSSSTLQKSSERLEIKDVTNGMDERDNQDSLTPEPSGYIVITEVPSDSENHSKSAAGGSVIIEDIEEPEVLSLESAESSDNISQYLDKDEPAETPEASTTTTKDEKKTENGQQERAKSEEPKRKRKLSIDSSYSRKSLSKLAIMKKLKEAKDKIKIPKLSLPKSLKPDSAKSKKETESKKEKESKKETESKKEKESKKETESKPKETSKHAHHKRNEIPVYVHIPLKPPEGETDEFSYLEFGEKKPEEETKVEEPEKPPEKVEIKIDEPELDTNNTDQRRFSEIPPDEIVAFEILKTETIDIDHATKNGLEGGNDYLIIQQDDDAKSENMIIIMPGTDEAGPSNSSSRLQTPSRQGSRRGRAKSAEPERKRKLSAESSYSRISLSKLGFLKKLKDAKDKLKLPKFTLSRSNSKKEPKKDKSETSLSKEPKKGKSETSLSKEPKKDKSETSSTKEPKKGKSETSSTKEPKKTKESKKAKTEPAKETKSEPKERAPKGGPKYIHIPLKPPEGETDEFSYLEFEEKTEETKPLETPKPTPQEPQSSIETPESPESPKTEAVQFIFLTPPSDDEILDHPDIPETPSSETKGFFTNRMDELKEIAKGAVDKVSPKPKKKILQPVSEEDAADTPKPEESKEEPEEPETDVEKPEKMVVDEEDGLKLTESAMAKQEHNIKAKEVPEELKSSLKSDSPVLKKKVSFKRRSRDDTKDGIYEEIQAPAGDTSGQKNQATDEHKSKLAVMGTSQSMSVDEEKSYLDEQKIIKSTSLEEDYNRWSKLSDHEYEPVNPPPDNVPPTTAAPPTVHVIDTDRALPQKTISLASSTTSLERRMLGAETETSPPEEPFTAQEMQTEIETKYFTKPEEPQPKPQTTVHTVTTVTTSDTSSQPPKPTGPGKFQQAIKSHADKFKTKLHEIKKPHIKLPSKPIIKKPNLQKFKFEKPKFNLPKMPDTSKISLPTFSLPRKSPLKRSLKERQLSTESNAGDSKKSYFDFRTYPRLFRKKPKDEFDSFSSKSEREAPEFATVPRTKRNQDRWGGRDSIRVPLHAEDSIESEEREEREEQEEREEREAREDSVERRMASHIRYDQDIDIDDAYEKENQEIHTASPFSHGYNSRWNHGSFHPEPNTEFQNKNRQVTDLDSPEDGPAPHESFDTNNSKDMHSSESSLGMHRRGVLEEIDSDEFFLRQKGISQDNIEVGMYLSSEIREAFKYPTNALADLQGQPRDFPYNARDNARDSNQSLPETPSKRKTAKKPKRKKTPHVSHEQISFDHDSELDGDVPPSRPKRRSKRNKKQKDVDNVVPYQETIAVEVPDVNVDVLRKIEAEVEEYRVMYENEQMQGKEQPEIKVIDLYADYEEKYDSEDEVFREEERKPSVPPRKNRSLKSLNFSEHDSILGDFSPDRERFSEDVEVYKTEHEYIIPTPELPPVKPPRTLSRSSSKSRENEDIEGEVEETPLKPTRTRSRSRTRSQADSLTLEEPCVEETCVEDFRDHMGYAVIDKHSKREPPLPPPRTPPRRKRSVQSTQSAVSEQKFFTVPRPVSEEMPVRPLRNYSTLGPSRPPRKKHPVNMTDEEKENIDITQYIEIEDEPNRDLHSGEVIQKMRDRPLPAPPRPPRKTRTLQDITSQENIATGSFENITDDTYDEEKPEFLEEAEVSTQTEPLDDYPCEEFQETVEPQEPLVAEESPSEPLVEQNEPAIVQRRLITPTKYSFEETITHGSLLVQPLNGAKLLPDSEISRVESPTERIVPVTKDYDDETSEIPEEFTKLKDRPAKTTTPQPADRDYDDETSEIPVEFTKLQDPTPVRPSATQPSVIERIIERPVMLQPDSTTEVEVLKAQKLQVSDLDVDRLSVNELLASRIIVSEIEGGSIQANEISSRSGALKIGEIELPPSLVQQLFEKLQAVAQEQSSGPPSTSTKEESEEVGQKKTPIEPVTVEALPPQRPPRKTEETLETSAPVDLGESEFLDLERPQSDSLNASETEEITEVEAPPEPPLRSDSSLKPQEIESTLDFPPDPEPTLDLPQDIEPILDLVEEIEETEDQTPQRPPRHVDKVKTDEPPAKEERIEDLEEKPQQMEEPEIDDEPPPRPPDPRIDYVPSQPPASFYALRAQQYLDSLEGDIPMAPRRRRHHKPPVSRSSSDESPPPLSRRRYRSPEPSIPQLTGQLLQACGSAASSSIKRLIAHITNNLLRNVDGQQDLHVIMVMLLVLIAGLILLGFGDGKTVHYHHWEYFNPPRDM